MQDNESLISEMLTLKDEIALNKHKLTYDMKSQWEDLKKKTKALEPKLSGTLLSLAKKTEKNNFIQYDGSATDIAQLVEEFRQFRQRMLFLERDQNA